MQEFFRGWRRKAGCVALAIALALMGCWIRSSMTIAAVSFQSGKNSMELLASVDYSLIWTTQHGEYVGPAVQFTCREISDDDEHLFENPRFTWHWRLCGFGSATILDGTQQLGTQLVTIPQGTLKVVPYWSIVIPLTLLSAYLMLVEPRTAKLPAESS